jgi:alpha-ribazole phosphatase/probable phosphoglycerate mutase
MLNIYFVRHGETVWNTKGIMQGRLDSELTEKGVLQAKNLSEQFENIDFEAVYSSELGRAYKTANILKSGRDIEVKKLEQLNEKNFGVWEGMQFKDIYLKYPKEAEKFFKNPAEYDARLINAESLIEALERFLDGIEKIKSLHSSGNILVVSHGTVLNLFFNYVEGNSVEKFSENEIMENSTYRIIEYSDF